MPDLTYTVNGTFDNNGDASINVCIPPEPTPGNYRTALFNLSKATGSETENVILCHFNNGRSTCLHSNSFNFHLKFNISTMTNYKEAVNFDKTKEEALYLFFHNETCEQADLDYFFDNIDFILGLIKQNGNQNGTIPLSNSVNQTYFSKNGPRKLGMSLIIKTKK